MKYQNSGGMKKILIILTIILSPLTLFGQLNGLGTIGSPFNGTFGTGDNLTWSGTVYVDGDIIVDNEQLTISPGTTIVFTTSGADLIITGTGQLNADGTALNHITFTRGTGNSSWGHISFQNMTTSSPSIINYCLVEYGDVRGNTSPSSYGGAIYVDFNNITISNCKIQHNKSEWGGGIFINHDKSITINNSIIFDNFSKEGGGGVYCWYRSFAIIENTIFDSNHCDGTTYDYYTGGGLGAQFQCGVTINNCTFVNNSSSRTYGQSLMFYSSVSDNATNCIFWGPGSHFYLSGINTINYCAVQSSTPPGAGNLILNSSNTATDGPNFSATDGSDWSIKFISPCRDAGIDIGLPTDILGKFRILLPDIGAYEVQYSNWTGVINTNWSNSTNWSASVDPDLPEPEMLLFHFFRGQHLIIL
jgi:hypothetical protein